MNNTLPPITKNHKSIKYPFHTYTPSDLHNKHILILGHGSITSPDIVEESARMFSSFTKDFEKYGIAALMPVLPRKVGPNPSQYLDSQILERAVMIDTCDPYYARPDKEIVKMIVLFQRELREKGYNISDTVFFSGASAGACMAQRMAVLYPDIVAGTAIFLSGIFLYPEKELESVELTYPFGVSDISALDGTQFNKELSLKIPQYIFVGEQETRGGPFDFEIRSQLGRIEEFRKVLGENPLEMTQKYLDYLKKQNTPFDAVIKKGVGHDCSGSDFRKGFEYIIENGLK
ncbi:MAG: hypothetical protein PHG63_00070 [Candidatus Dojkabacteria bacterium]|nr:hypothetical protein [Candidatus Dojkabacteria bacterium]